MQRHGEARRDVRCLRARVRDARDLAIGVRGDLFQMAHADQPGARHRDTDPRHSYLCLKAGFCFSTNAFMPIFWSSLANSEWKRRRSKCTPSASVPSNARLTASLAIMIDGDRKSTRLNSSHVEISYAVFCLKKKKK